MSVITRGDREISLRFDRFPAAARNKIMARIEEFTEQLQGMVEAAAPHKTGLLRSEITEKIYSNRPERIAGYVSVFAQANPTKEYPKAATLEYGTSKPRRSFQKQSAVDALLGRSRRRIVNKLSRPVLIEAFEYLRKPLAEMKPEIDAGLAEALAEATAEQGD